MEKRRRGTIVRWRRERVAWWAMVWESDTRATDEVGKVKDWYWVGERVGKFEATAGRVSFND